MATYNPTHNSILDAPHGHIGPVIFYSWKGIDCVRTMPQHYRDARTTQQLQNRSKLAILMAFQSIMKAPIQNGYQHTTHNTTELNEATRINYRTALTTQGTTAHISYPNTYLSWGSLPQLPNLQYLILDNELLIHWDTQTIPNPNDQVHIALYNETQHTAQYHPNITTRQAQSLTLPIPQNWQHDHIHCWIWLSSTTQNSTSQYLGTLNIPPSTTSAAPQPTPESHGPKCYQTPPSLGPETHPKPDSHTPAPPPK